MIIGNLFYNCYMNEGFNWVPKKEVAAEPQLLEKFTKFLKNRVLIGSMAIASLGTFEGCVGVNDYTSTGSFSKAFKKAQQNKEQEFEYDGKKFSTKYEFYEKKPDNGDTTLGGDFNTAFKTARDNSKEEFAWHGRLYNTKLVDTEFSELYWESKKFLEEYYSSEYFLSKYTYTPDWLDSANAEDAVSHKWESTPRFKYLKEKEEKSEYGMIEDNKEYEEYENLREKTYNTDYIRHSKLYKELLDSIIVEKSGIKDAATNRLKNLHTPTYFSITDFKGKVVPDGTYDSKDEKIFIYGGKQKARETTPIHELTHKSTKGNKAIHLDHWLGLRNAAYESMKKNNLIRKHVKELANAGYSDEIVKIMKNWIDYMSNPTEIDARQNSTRFWLYRHFPDFKVNTVFSAEHFEFLKKQYKNLPYDIQQLLDLFPDKDDFINNMNKY